MTAYRAPLASRPQHSLTLLRRWLAHGWRRRALCLVLICGLLVVPDAGYAVRAATDVAVKVAKDTFEPLPVAVGWVKHLFRRAAAHSQRETTADRNARVQHIRLSPGRFVGYVGETITFVAMGLDASGQPAHGAKFDWSTNDTNKVQLDDAGRATLIHPGLARITCRVGAVEATARLLIRPTRRPLQTDEQWRSDQDELQADPADGIGLLSAPSALLDKLLPTAQAQLNSPGDYGADAQTIGSPMFTPKEPTRLGSVLSTDNFELAMPICNVGGRGLATSLNLYYNSNVWGGHFDQSTNETVHTFDPIQSWPSPGFSLGFGRIVYYNGYTDANLVSWHSFTLIDPDGTRHGLGVGQDYGNNTLQTTDGSHLTYVGNAANGGTLYYNDGTIVNIGKVNNRLLPTMITDTNGNYIQIGYNWEPNYFASNALAISYIVDTLGRVIQFHYGEWPAPSATALSSISGPGGSVTFSYQTVTMNAPFYDSFGNLGGATQNMPASFYGISGVTISARPSYQFSYSGYGMIYQVTGNGGGGTGTMSFDYPLGGEGIYVGPKFTQRTETGSNTPTGVFSYGVNGVTRPDGTVLTLGGGIQQLKSSSGAVLSEVDTAYTTDPGGSPAVQSIITTDDIGQQTKVDFDYDQYGNVTNKREYGFKVNGQWQVRRRMQYTYVTVQVYQDKYIRNLIQETDVYDAMLNTNDADDVLIGKTVVGYDNYGAMGGMENYGGAASPPGHLASLDATVTVRGNITGVTTYPDLAAGVTRSQKIDIFGNTTKAQVSCCSEKTFYCDGHTDWARPCTVTSGNLADKCLTTMQTYNFSTLEVTSVTDANNQTTTYSYDAAGRMTGTTRPTGVSSTAVYNGWGGKTSSSISYSEGGTTKTLTETNVYDGWGQVTRSVDPFGAQVNYTYDAMGRVLTQTNPFPQGTTPGPVTTNTYDLLGRVTQVTQPGGNTLRTVYTGSNLTRVTDQVGRQIKRESDGLGRLIKVTEQDASGTLAQETSYTYDVADRLTLVNQGNQTRAFKYDAQGRLLYERIPEQTATINDGGGTYWTTKYTYTDWGAVSTRQDARGVITTYSYDTLHRTTSVSYNTSGAPGVASTSTATYTYDNGSTCDTTAHTATAGTKGLLLSMSVGSSYSESYSYDSNDRVQAVTRVMDGKSYTTSYQYNTANQMTQVVYPVSNRTLNINHDNLGRVSSLADQYRTYVGSIVYDGIGRVSSYSRGNGMVESFGYDVNRMQMTSQTATLGGTTLINLHYSYDAQAGQTGAGTNAGNANQLMGVVPDANNNPSTINGTTESASYAYDNVGRLVSSSQTSNGQSAQRRFVYDRWGNRTEVWDAVSGGWRIQYASLEQAGGAPTNRLLSLYTASSGYNYLYDAAGNVTNDGLHTYTYDAESRLVSVDGGATASYSYDQQNHRYKKTAGGSATHYVWQGGEVIGEYDASSGAALMNYVWQGGKLVASMGSGILKWMVSDRLSVRLVLDANGAVIGRQGHLPFGEDFAESGTQQKQHFTSYERDGETGTDYAVNRQYNQSVGRFNRVDPYSGSNNIGSPQSLNRYAYAENEPIDRTDSLGLFPGDPVSRPSIIDLGNGQYAIKSCFILGENRWCEWRIYTEYEPRGDQRPTSCQGHTKAPLTGEKLDKYNAERDILRQKLTSDQCMSYLIGFGIDPAQALESVNMQRAYDGNKSQISYLEAGLIPPELADSSNRFQNSCISGEFKYKGKNLGAMTATYPNQLPPSQTTVADRSDVYYGDNFSAASILHEALHSLLGLSDDELAKKLGNIDISKGSKEISKALQKNGCGD